jgi:carbon monoxide dehydrogenase subunit G
VTTVDIAGSHFVRRDSEVVTRTSSDMTKIAPCLKGLQIEELTPQSLTGRIRVAVGVVRGAFDLKASVRKLGQHLIELQVELKGVLGAARGTILVEASSTAQHETRVTWRGQIELKGLAANIARSQVEQVANNLVQDIYECLFD